MEMKARVFCIVKKELPELAGRQGVRSLRNGGTEVECRLSLWKEDGAKTIYSIEPVVDLPLVSRYFELQMTEWGEKNIGAVITNRSGRRLDPRWRKKTTVGFRTSRGQLVEIVRADVSGTVQVVEYTLVPEGKEIYLLRERKAFCRVDFGKDDRPDMDHEAAEEHGLTNFGEAIAGARSRARCYCFKVAEQNNEWGHCHYALNEEESRVFRAERRERQRQRDVAEMAKRETEGSKVGEVSGEVLIPSETPAPEMNTEEPNPPAEKPAKSRKSKKASASK